MIKICALLRFVLALVLTGLPGSLRAEKLKTENVFLIMSDGLRWQEVFRGAEERLLNQTHGGVANTNAVRQEFWRDTDEERRAALLPFFWNEIARKGQLFGNTNKGSVAKLTNGRKFSYPGYNEVITGVGDPRINSNDKIPNLNTNVFEWLNQQRPFAKRVAVFGNWDAFAYIFNCERSKLPIWPVWEEKFVRPDVSVSPVLQNVFEDTTPIWNSMTLDSLVFNAAINHVKEKRPKVLFLGLGETDEWAHEKRYDLYLASAHHADNFIQRLWTTVQSIPSYRNKTTFIITCDHGRGGTDTDWKDHGRTIPGAEYIWLAVLGPDTAALGERTNCADVGQNQIAATLAAFLGNDFHAAFPNSGATIKDVLGQR